MNSDELNNLIKNVKQNDFSLLSVRKYSEKSLLSIVNEIKLEEAKYLELFFSYITNYQFNEFFDWNMGSIIQHFNSEIIITELKKVPERKRTYLYESIGLVWALGELDTKNTYIVDFLYEVMNYAKNHESWWSSAFSLRKLTGKNPINNLKRSVKRYPSQTTDACLADLSNKRNIIHLLLNANNQDIKNKIYPALKKSFMESMHRDIILNSMWVLGHLRLFDDDINKKILNLIEISKDYDVIYSAYVTLSKEPNGFFENTLLSGLQSKDPLVRKISLRGLAKLNSRHYIDKLEDLFDSEQNPSVVAEASVTISAIKNEHFRNEKKFFPNVGSMKMG